MYVRGLSPQDVSALYRDTFGANRLSKSTVSRVTQQLNQDFETWRRDLSELHSVRAWLSVATRIVALTGAGISTDSGIPDFRGPQGVWTKNPDAEKLSNIAYYMTDPEVRKLSWQSRVEHPTWHAEPNAGHRALVELERRGQLHAIITQNIDGLHQKAGSSPANVIEVHGTMREAMCMQCDWRGAMEPVLERVRRGEIDPPCTRCGGILKSATISFGQALVPKVIDRAMRAARATDLLLAVGTSLQVYPVAGTVPLAKSTGALVVILNAEPTPFDDIADAVFRQPIGEVLPSLCVTRRRNGVSKRVGPGSMSAAAVLGPLGREAQRNYEFRRARLSPGFRAAPCRISVRAKHCGYPRPDQSAVGTTPCGPT